MISVGLKVWLVLCRLLKSWLIDWLLLEEVPLVEVLLAVELSELLELDEEEASK